MHSAELHLDLGKAYQSSGNIEKAIKAFNTVVELVPDKDIAKEAKERAEKLTRQLEKSKKKGK